MKILFISHEATRTGAPIVLLNLVRWLRSQSDFECVFLLAKDGDLRRSFEDVAPTIVYGEVRPGTPRGIIGRLIRKMGVAYKDDYSRSRLQSVFPAGSIDLIYSNTIANGAMLNELTYLGAPVITHVHELDGVIQYYGKPNLEYNLSLTNIFIAVSTAVRDNLVIRHSVAADKVLRIPGSVDLSGVSNSRARSAAFRRELGLPEDFVIVGGAGSDIWQKGKDLFMQVAMHVRRIGGLEGIVFLWVGGDEKAHEQRAFVRDIKRAGLEAQIKIIWHIPNPLDYFSLFNIFLMTSREDSYPLVNIEAAAFATPVLCFQGSGGSEEFVGSRCGFVVPYADTVAMAEKVILLAKNVELRKELGMNAEIRAAEHDIHRIGPQVLDVIRRITKTA